MCPKKLKKQAFPVETNINPVDITHPITASKASKPPSALPTYALSSNDTPFICFCSRCYLVHGVFSLSSVRSPQFTSLPCSNHQVRPGSSLFQIYGLSVWHASRRNKKNEEKKKKNQALVGVVIHSQTQTPPPLRLLQFNIKSYQIKF